MAELTGPIADQPRPRYGRAAKLVIAIQLLFWLLTGCIMDHGRIGTGYTIMLLPYWLLIGAARLSDSGPAVARLIAYTGWVPPVGCVVWMVFGRHA